MIAVLMLVVKIVVVMMIVLMQIVVMIIIDLRIVVIVIFVMIIVLAKLFTSHISCSEGIKMETMRMTPEKSMQPEIRVNR